MAAAASSCIPHRTSRVIPRSGRHGRCPAISRSGSMEVRARSIWGSGVTGPATDDSVMKAGAGSTLAAAFAHHRAGRLAEAERLYRAVCDNDRDNARAFHLWGVAAHQLGRPDA